MGLPAAQPRLTLAEYFEAEETALEKHEFHDGEILAMAGGGGDHSLIILNVMGELRNRLKGKPCLAYESNLRIRVPRHPYCTYPDGSVICGSRETDPKDKSGQTFTNPRLIVEVLSPSTEAYDRGEKFSRYRDIDSFQEYVLVTQTTPRVEVFFRQPEGTWLFAPYSGIEAVAKLRSLDITLPLAEIYAGVSFPPVEPEPVDPQPQG